jgi:hypothetical protein
VGSAAGVHARYANGGAGAGSTDRPAHQCRISECGLYPAGQHHDAGADRHDDVDAAFCQPGGERAGWFASANRPGIACSGGGEKACGVQAAARNERARAGCDCARGRFACSSICSRGIQRVIPPQARTIIEARSAKSGRPGQKT